MAETGLAFEQHYTIPQIAELWGMSDDMVRRDFRSEPGVLRYMNKGNARTGRGYTSLRVPKSVMERVHRRRLGA